MSHSLFFNFISLYLQCYVTPCSWARLQTTRQLQARPRRMMHSQTPCPLLCQCL